MDKFKVTINVAGGAISCKEKGGHLIAGKGDEISWISNEAFKLTFTYLKDGTRAPWPFVGGEPSWPQPKFTGTLNPPTKVVYYKYTIEVASCPPLDPIVIVDH